MDTYDIFGFGTIEYFPHSHIYGAFDLLNSMYLTEQYKRKIE
jgi:hypothetical protein